MEALWLFGAVVYFMVVLPISIYMNVSDREGYEELPLWVVITFTCIATVISAILWPIVVLVAILNVFRERRK